MLYECRSSSRHNDRVSIRPRGGRGVRQPVRTIEEKTAVGAVPAVSGRTVRRQEVRFRRQQNAAGSEDRLGAVRARVDRRENRDFPRVGQDRVLPARQAVLRDVRGRPVGPRREDDPELGRLEAVLVPRVGQ